MISAVCWVPKGSHMRMPLRFELSAEEITAMQKELQSDEEDEADGEHKNKSSDKIPISSDADDLPDELNMDAYDDEEITSDLLADAALNIDEDDVVDDEVSNMDFIKDQNTGRVFVNDSDDSDAEDYEIRPTDSILMLAKTEMDDDYSSLEIQIYNEEDGNLFTHHDITLPAFPLSIAWMNCPPYPPAKQVDGSVTTTLGSYVAIGTFEPAIEIWNLDVIDALEPSATLGGTEENVKKKKKKKKNKNFLPGSHQDAVLGLSWNAIQRQVLASGSADETVKIWDVTTQQCSHTFDYPTNKVQAVQWHPVEATLLAAVSYDQKVSVVDVRSPHQTLVFKISADPEALNWNPHNPTLIHCATEDGNITAFDVRASRKPLCAFTAHEKGVSSFSFCQKIAGLLATCSVDKTVKIWDILNVEQPLQVASKSMAVGKLFSVQFYPDVPFLLACGGDTGVVALWHTNELDAVKKTFRSRQQGFNELAEEDTVAGTEKIADSMAGMQMETEDVEKEGSEKKKKKKKKKNLK